MGQQLRLPLYAALPEPVRRVAETLRSEPVVVSTTDGFEPLYAELDGLLRRFQGTMSYGPKFVETWHKAREATCKAHGWTVEGFYAELFRRRRST